MTGWQDSGEDFAAIKDWFDRWGADVAARDFAAARPLFDDGVVGFGTWMDLVEGLDGLEAQQWRSVWPTIEGFRHETDRTLKVRVSPDRLLAVGLVTWTSSGFAADGAPYDRPGRTTAVFVRAQIAAPWRCVHTHVSLFRGVPQKSHGAKLAQEG
ncbi:MAG: nuclear transport factor 2 family protein [Rhodospirillales bacterium]